MNSVKSMIRRAQINAAVIEVLRDARTTLRILQLSGASIDLRQDIEKINGALILLGFPD